MKKMDIILISVVLILAGGLYFLFSQGAEDGAYAVILVDGEELTSLPLAEDTIYTIEHTDGYNTVEVRSGYAVMQEADCRDQICVEHKQISRVGETIVCLPHKLVVEIKGDTNSDFDAVVG